MYRRFVDLDILPEPVHKIAAEHIRSMDMIELALVLNEYESAFEETLLSVIGSENGADILKKITKSISNNIQLKLFNLLEGNS